ncbi:hypothetical protein PILCRDRAFT_748136 [Piloderma croceum F 1598]|uniref:Uncharacterized protein n=1 Tax=Piloderma croceum (strain F 1598) TaxID=765440 RepID=A0A0C3EVP9_PILCF|nr:hypothetical protein PILCRDRAFT_748136 [Piloderma croceum F 1598]
MPGLSSVSQSCVGPIFVAFLIHSTELFLLLGQRYSHINMIFFTLACADKPCRYSVVVLTSVTLICTSQQTLR